MVLTDTDTDTATVPRAVEISFRLWLLAVAAGLFETVLVVTDGLVEHTLSGGAIVSGAGVRLVVFAVALVLAFRMRAGSRAASLALTVLLGVLGLASLLVGPLEWLADGAPDPHLRPVEWVFAGSRVVHVAAVLGAVAAMYAARARRWFRG